MRRRPEPSGAVMIAVVVCLVIVALICGTLLRLGRALREQARQDEVRLQAAWLAEAGLDRAADRLAGAADYPGEVWEIPAADLGGPRSAVVRIAVEPVARRPSRRRVTARAEHPRGPRQTKRAMVDLDHEPTEGTR